MPPALAPALSDPRALALVGAAMQCVLALVHAAALAGARRHERMRSGGDFVVAQLGLALATLAVVLRNVHGPLPVAGEANLLLRVLAGTYLSGKLLFYAALAAGTAQMLGHVPPRRVPVAGGLALAALGVAYAVATPVLAAAFRLQGVVGIVLMTAGAAALLRADPALRTTGMRLLAAAFALYALLALPYVLGARYSGAYDAGSLWHASLWVLDRSSVTDIAGQFLLGIALVVLLLEQQREVAVREGTQRDALHREAAATARLETLGRVAATVAHELNNPLSVVLGTAEHLLATAGDPAQRDDLRLMVREATRCRHVARDLLLYARDQAPRLEPVDARAILHGAVDAVRLQAVAAGVRLDVGAAHPAVLRADASALEQVLINLLRNAIEVAPPASVVRATAAREGDEVAFAVEDWGPGIAPEVRARLFEPFVTTKPAGHGTGLGLSIVRGIVARHGGTLEVESAPERAAGARFVVRVPAGEVATGEYAAAAVAAPPAPADAPAATPATTARWVLVVDDEVGVRRVLGRMVERHGLRVELCEDGIVAQGALRHAPLDTLDAIFCDVRMPRLDGIAFAEWLAEAHPALLPRLVLLTGDTVSDEVSAAAQRTGCRLMAKPFRREEIDAVLGATVGG